VSDVAGAPLCVFVSYLRDSAEANLAVRVGVHSGRVESAIVGLSRWRYDVWSADVQITEQVVHAGLPGSVNMLYNHLAPLLFTERQHSLLCRALY